MGSAIRDGIRELERRGARQRRGRKEPQRPTRRGGLLDLFLVIGVVLLAGARTPVGGLVRYGASLAADRDTPMPTLTAWFDSGAAAPPDLEQLELADPDPIPEGGLPEPWRTAARTVLADPPKRLAKRLEARTDLPEDDRLMAALDQLYEDDPEAALEHLALGPELRERAIARARAAGESNPAAYASHRRYLPPGAARDADRVVHGTLALASALDLAWPVRAKHRVSSPFGYRDHPTLKRRKFHNGIDLAVPIGTAIHAPQHGTVLTVGENKASGKYLVVDHGHGLRTAYCHLSASRVLQGSKIARGQLLADSGNTGRSTGPHLHWIVRIAGKPVDPARFRPRLPPEES